MRDLVDSDTVFVSGFFDVDSMLEDLRDVANVELVFVSRFAEVVEDGIDVDFVHEGVGDGGCISFPTTSVKASSSTSITLPPVDDELVFV